MHYYNYQNDPWNASLYVNTRFASEYGFQAWPSFRSIANVSLREDWQVNSQFSQQRQHHAGGNEEISNLIRKRLPLPEDDGSQEFYATWFYLSQVSIFPKRNKLKINIR